jgi:hypothetical protein
MVSIQIANSAGTEWRGAFATRLGSAWLSWRVSERPERMLGMRKGAASGPMLTEEASHMRWNCEAFWCRGILPKAGTGPLRDLSQAPTADLNLTTSMGQLIVVGSDGSGDEHGSDVRPSRAGWSWTALAPAGQQLGSIFGGIEDDHAQTVPRAELHAAVHCLQHVATATGVRVELRIDNAHVVHAFH